MPLLQNRVADCAHREGRLRTAMGEVGQSPFSIFRSATVQASQISTGGRSGLRRLRAFTNNVDHAGLASGRPPVGRI